MAEPAGQGDAQSQAALGMMGPMFVFTCSHVIANLQSWATVINGGFSSSSYRPAIPANISYPQLLPLSGLQL